MTTESDSALDDDNPTPEEAEYQALWWATEMRAGKWWRERAISPATAARLLCGYAHDISDAHLAKLNNGFVPPTMVAFVEDLFWQVETDDGKPLAWWVAYARCHGLPIHRWIVVTEGRYPPPVTAPLPSKRETQRDRIAALLVDIGKRAEEADVEFDRHCMPGTKADLLVLMRGYDPALRTMTTSESLDNHIHGLCKWPKSASSNPSALPLYARLFPEIVDLQRRAKTRTTEVVDFRLSRK